MVNAEIIKVHAGQILSCGQVTGNNEFTIGGLIQVPNDQNTLIVQSILQNMVKKIRGYTSIITIKHA